MKKHICLLDYYNMIHTSNRHNAPPKETQIYLNYKKMNEQSKQSYLGKHHKCIPLESLEQFWPLMSCDGQH